MSATRRSCVAVAALILAAIVAPSAGAEAAALPLEHLQPGEFADVQQRVPVTVVFVGLEPGAAATLIDSGRLVDAQLREHRIGDRTTRFIEREKPARLGDWYQQFLEPSTIGLTYRFDYRTVFADASFEDAFFGYLASIAIGPIPGGTIFQQAYSAQPLAAQRIPASYLIDATAAEQWLAANAGPMLAVDTTRPTVFFINWFGRPDFRFHTYAFLGQRPGATFPLGLTHVGQMVAWGASPPDVPYGGLGRQARVWFYDVSAGPDYTTANWLLAPPDFDGDGVTDERIPPIWEYGTTHWYRPFDDLTGDLARLLRFVAVDALFGASPLYDPAISEPLLADRVELDLNLFAGRPDRDPSASLRADALPAIFARLDPTRQVTVDAATRSLSGEVAAVFDCQQTAYTDQPRSCFGNRAQVEDDPATPVHDGVFYDLDLYFEDHGPQYLDGTRYEVPVAVFDVPDSRLAPGALAGLASSRFPNLQGWTYAWLADRFRAALVTDTGLVTHEVGHHLGLSHVHDTYDPAIDDELTAKGPFWFLATGMETYTVMSYLPNTDEFGQFDRDHLARWQVAARLDNANRILGDIQRSPHAGAVAATVLAADAKAGEALAALDGWDLPRASRAAADAYRLVLDAATTVGVTVEPFAGVADQSGIGVITAAIDDRDAHPRAPPGLSDYRIRYP
jgi:hypothetical protein